MKRVQLSDLREHLDEYIAEVKKGETVDIQEGETIVATIQRRESLERTIERLADEGIIRKGSGEPLPDWFFTEPLPKFEGSIVEQVLKDRRESDR